MTLADAIRDRLLALAAQAQTAAEALAAVERLDLSPEEQAGLLSSLDRLALQLGDVAERLAGGVDPARCE